MIKSATYAIAWVDESQGEGGGAAWPHGRWVAGTGLACGNFPCGPRWIAMAIAKVIEVIVEGDTIEDAIETGVKEASTSIHGIRGVYAENIQAIVEDGKVIKYRVNAKMTFVVD